MDDLFLYMLLPYELSTKKQKQIYELQLLLLRTSVFL